MGAADPTTKPMTSPDEELAKIQDLYDSVYYRNPAASEAVPAHYRKLAERLAIRQGTQVLDVACSTGTWLRATHQRGAAVAGIDLSGRAIEICRVDVVGGRLANLHLSIPSPCHPPQERSEKHC